MPAFVAPLVGFSLGVLLAWLSSTTLIVSSGPRPPWFSATSPAPLSASATPRLAPLSASATPRLAPLSASATPRLAPADLRGRPLALAALFSGLVFTPICLYFLVFYPDWSFAYLINTRRIPSAVDLVLLMIDAASVPAGVLVVHRLTRASIRTLASLVAAPLGLAALAVLALARRLAVDGTYRQVHGDFGTHPVAGGPLGYALLWMGAMLAAGFAITVRALYAARDLSPPRPAGQSLQPSTPGSAGDVREVDPPAQHALPVGSTSAAPQPPARRLGTGRR